MALVTGLSLTTCATAPAPRPHRPLSPEQVFLTRPTPFVEGRLAPEVARPQGPILPGNGAFAVLPEGRYLPIFKEPAGRPTGALDPQNPWRQEAPFLVTGAKRDRTGRAWLRVLMPARPNGTTRWVPRNRVALVREPERIVVDLSERTLWHYRGGRLVHRFTVAVGAPGTPTPSGTFFVWAHVRQGNPLGPYGAFVLGLSGWSEAIRDGRLAIHGTAHASDAGLAVSHGCIRVYNPQMMLLRQVPLGTPVIIRP